MTDAEQNGPSHTDSCFVPCGRHDGPWFCVWTVPNGEITALQALRRFGFPTFLPEYTHTWANRQSRISPLFPRYLFAQPLDGQWSGMLRQRGVADVLRRGGRPIEVPPGQMERLFRQCAPNGVIYPRAVRVDEMARVTEGSMAGFEGICTRSEGDRVALMLHILGSSVPMEFDARAVVVAG